MGQLLDMLIGMDPAGDGALLLCAITAALLGILLVVGFGRMRPPKQSPRHGPGRRVQRCRAGFAGLVASQSIAREERPCAAWGLVFGRLSENDAVIGRQRFPLAVAATLAMLVMLLGGCQSAGQSAPALDPSRPAQALAVDPSDGSLLKAAGGVFRSTDRGRTWSALAMPADLQPAAIQQVATTSAAPGSLFAAGPGAGVIRSDDDGRNWSSASGNLPSKDVAVLAVHSFHPGTLYVLIIGGGIYRTEDGGDQWQKMDDGPRAKVLGLAHSTLPGSMNTGWLYAATEDGPYLSMDCF